MDKDRIVRLALLFALLMIVPTMSGCEVHFGGPIPLASDIKGTLHWNLAPFVLINAAVALAGIALLAWYMRRKGHDNSGLDSMLVYLAAAVLYFVPLTFGIMPKSVSALFFPYLLPHIFTSLNPIVFLTTLHIFLSWTVAYLAVWVGMIGAYWTARRWPKRRWQALATYFLVLVALGAAWWWIGILSIDFP